MSRWISIILLSFVASCCFVERNTPFSENYMVERVMMHDPNFYTLFVKEPGDKLTPVQLRAEQVILTTDVPRGEPMRATYRGTTRTLWGG